jgi:hypothetical protein
VWASCVYHLRIPKFQCLGCPYSLCPEYGDDIVIYFREVNSPHIMLKGGVFVNCEDSLYIIKLGHLRRMKWIIQAYQS